MSLSTAPARTARPTTDRVAHRPAPAPRRRPRAVMPPRRPLHRRVLDRLARVPFLVTCAVLLVTGLLSVLVLNMTISQTSYTLSELQEKAQTLDDQALALQHDLDEVSSAPSLARQASALGLGPVSAPMFLDPQTGKVSGVAKQAGRTENFTVVTGRDAAGTAPATASRSVTDPTTGTAGLGLGGTLVGAVASLAAR